MTKIKPVGINPKEWSEPFGVLQSHRWPTDPGIYRVIVMQDNNPVSIRRICKVDKNGILYIGKASGMSGGLRNRLQALCRAWKDQKSRGDHESAERFFRNRALQDKFNASQIYVEYRRFQPNRGKAGELVANGLLDSTSAYDMTTVEERSELWRYEQQFGELPPLNNREGDHLK